jgi:hypothetical protein
MGWEKQRLELNESEPQRLKPGFFAVVAARLEVVPFPVAWGGNVNVKGKVKGSGQECPLHTIKAGGWVCPLHTVKGGWCVCPEIPRSA